MDKKKLIPVMLALIFIALSTISYHTQEMPTPPSPEPQALASPMSIITMSTAGQTYDCNGGAVGGFKIKANNTHIIDCDVNATTDYSFEIRANGTIIENVRVFNNRTEGSIFDFVLPDGSCVSNTTVTNIYANGDVGWGITGRICGMTMTDGEFYRIGKSSNSGKHWAYLNHSNNITFTNIYVYDVWNSCVKIVGNVSYIYFQNVVCENIGMSRDYGSALMIGEGGDTARSTNAHHLYLNGFQAINVRDDKDVEIYDERTPVTEVYINGVYYPTLYSMENLPPVQAVTTVTPTQTGVPSYTPTKTITPSRTPTRTVTVSPTVTRTPTSSLTLTPTRTPTITPVPTFCETAVSEHFWFQGCSQ